MDLREYLRAVRRRWSDVALAVTAALIAGWLITAVAPAGPVIHEYQATSVVLSTGYVNSAGGSATVANLKTLAELATIPKVAERVAGDVHFDGDPQSLAGAVQATGDQESGLLKITARSQDAEQARAVADGFARELIGFLSESQSEANATSTQALRQRLDTLQESVDALDARIAGAGLSDRGLLTAQRDAEIRQYGLLYEQYQQLASAARLGADGLQIVQQATPVLVSEGGIQAPHSRTSRLILAGILGLIAGLALVLFLERFDTKIRTKEGSERAFALPVLAEIPSVPARRRKDLMVTTTKGSGSLPANAFRILGAALSHFDPVTRGLAGGNGGGNGAGNGAVNGAGQSARNGNPPQIILITSPGPSEGKTTITANLAATFAGLGKKVVVVSCDFRRPRIHEIFGVPAEPGLMEGLSSSNGRWILHGRIFDTSTPNILVVPSGSSPDHPSELLGSQRMRRVLQELRERADVVLLDTAPIMTVSDATYLLPEVDAVLVVARAGRTTAELAERTSELLKRARAPVVGVALNAAKDMPVPRGYYGYHRYHKSVTSDGNRGFPYLFRRSVKG